MTTQTTLDDKNVADIQQPIDKYEFTTKTTREQEAQKFLDQFLDYARKRARYEQSKENLRQHWHEFLVCLGVRHV